MTLILGDELEVAVAKVIDETPNIERLRQVARVYFDITGYLDEHDPRGSEQYGRFPCSRSGYHRCSGKIVHSDECARGEAGDRQCPDPCDEGPPEPWCHVNGFDCSDCAAVARLNAILTGVAA